MKQGIDANVQSMSQAEKTLLRYQYVMANTKAAAGDFARTSNTWANQTRLLGQSFQELGAIIGNALINAFGPALQALNNFMLQVISIVETIANALGALFGWTVRVGSGGKTAAVGYAKLGKSVMKVSDAMKSASGSVTTMESGMESVTDKASSLQSGFEEIPRDITPVFTSAPTEAAGGLSDSLDEANENAKDLKRTLLGFDQINRLDAVTNSKGSGGSGGGGGGGGGADGAEAGEAVFERTESLFDLMKSDIKSLEELGEYIGDALINAMKKIDWNSIYEKARNFGSGLASFLNGLISPELFSETGRLIANALNTALSFLNSFGDTFDWTNFGKSIAAGLNSFFKNFKLGLAADTFDKFVNGILDAMIAAAEDIEWERIGAKIRDAVYRALSGIEWNKAFEAASLFGSGLAKFLNGLIDEKTFSLIGSTLANTLNTVLHFLDSFGETFEWDKFGQSLATGLNTFFTTWNAGLTADTFSTFINGVVSAIVASTGNKGVNWTMIGSKISEFVRQALAGIVWSNVYTALGNFGSGVASFMNSLITEDTFSAIGRSIARTVRSVIHGVKNWVVAADFYGWGSALGSALNSFFGNIDWGEVGLTLDGLISGFVEFLKGLVDTGSFESFGQKIGEALSEVNWLGHLFDAAKAIADAIKDLLVGMANTPAGKFIEKLGLAFAAVKMTSAIYKFVDGIATILGGDRNTRILKEAMEKILGKAAEGASTPTEEKLNPLKSVLEKIGGAAKDAGSKTDILKTLLLGLGQAGVYAGIVTGATELAKFKDAADGGNGELSELGGLIDSVEGSFTGPFATALNTAKEELENSGAKTDEWAQKLSDLFINAGVGSQDLQEIFNNLGGSYSMTAEQADLVSQTIDLVRQSEENWSAEQQTHAEEADAAYATMRDALTTLQQEGIIPSQEHMDSLVGALDNAHDSGYDAAGMLKELKTQCENNSVPFEDLEKVLGTDFVKALETAADSTSTNTKKISDDTKTNLGSAKQSASDATKGIVTDTRTNMQMAANSVTTHTGTIASTTKTNMNKAKDSVSQSTSSMKSDVESTMPTVKSKTTDAMTESERVSREKWNSAYTAISEALSNINGDVRDIMNEVMTTIQNKWSSVVINTNQIWELISSKIEKELGNASTSVDTKTADMISKFTSMKSSVDTTFSGIQTTIKTAVSTIESMLTTLKSKAQTVTDNVKTFFNNMVTKISTKVNELKSIGTKGINGFATGVNNAKSRVTSAITSMMTSVVNKIKSYNTSLRSAGVSAGQAFASGFRSVHISVPHIYVSGYTSHSVGSGSVSTPNFGVSWYGKGGLPNMGEMFIAREAGPELVGKIGSRNAVANNMQITEGIRSAVVDGLMEVMMATSGSQSQDSPYVINVTVKTQDDEVLARAVERGRLKRGERYNPSIAY